MTSTSTPAASTSTAPGLSTTLQAPAGASPTTLRAAQRKRGFADWLLTANLWVIFIFFYAPILVLVLFSFNSGRFVSQWEGFSLQWYVTLFQNEAIARALWNSLIVATVSTVVSTVLVR